MTKTPLGELWPRLRSIRTLRFAAASELDTGWNGVGEGAVAVSEPSEGVLVFDEAGTWRPPDRAALRFINVFRWTALGDSLRLEHLRFGPHRPVLLFEMASHDDGTWRDVSPHLCDQDCYSATLAFAEQRLIVAWSVRGPHKRETIRYEYW